jgi:hypothetical protein
MTGGNLRVATVDSLNYVLSILYLSLQLGLNTKD